MKSIKWFSKLPWNNSNYNREICKSGFYSV